LLGVTRADLRSYLRRNGVVWADDPTNDDTHYTRVRARKALAQLGSLGITAQGLAAVSDHLETARQALLGQLGTAAQGVTETAAGSLMIPHAGFDPLPAEIKRRLLIAALRWISAASYPPREAALANLVQVMGQGGDTTLGGVRFRSTATTITVQREARAQRGQICATDQTWDNRWQLSGPHAPDLTIRALGADGLRQVKDWRDTGLPRDALLVTPAIWRDETLIAAPCAGFSNGWCANCSPSFASFVLSH
jgi:tRNA(Ile)-lysidine synthase